MTRAESLQLLKVTSSVSVSEMDPKGFPELKHLRVDFGYGIQYIVKKNYNNCIFPKLETLGLCLLDKLERICDDHDHPSPVGSFENLRVINVSNCDLLNDLLSSNLARGLSRLEEISVVSCKNMESIIVSRESENEEEIKIGFTDELRVLELKYLPHLLNFYRLKQLEGVPSATPLFNKKIVFPKLEELILEEIKVEKIWDDESAISAGRSCWLQNLTSLIVDKCDNLSYLFTSSMVKSLAKLQHLRLHNCKSIEEIIALTERETPREIQLLFPKLDKLELEDLPNLKRFCHPNIFECQLLRELLIKECPTLTSIFPTSLVRTLQQLERLEVQNCDKIDWFGFNNTQQLTDAIAKVISNLKYYRLESGGTILRKCEHQNFKLEILGCGFQVSPILFALLKSVPKLDEVVVSSYSIIQLFPCEPDHLAADDGGDMDTQIETFARIQHLTLAKLSYMKNILSEHSPLKYHGVPRDLKVLEVVDCDSLLSLAPPSTTLFKNLTSLVVQECPMLIKLVESSSTAKSFVNLKKMSVERCDSLEEILAIDHQCNDEYIVFEKLEVLALRDLNSLTSFCSTSDCNFWFPSLNRVIVEKCPNMKFFSKGSLSTPKLIRVIVEANYLGDEKLARWEGDFNSTIRQLFEEMGHGRDEDEDENEDEDDDGDEHENEEE